MRSCSPSASRPAGWKAIPTPRLPWVDVATGSLGQGLPVAVGIALGPGSSSVPHGSGCCAATGSWPRGRCGEAFERAGHDRLGNLIAIIDANGRGQCGATMFGGDPGKTAARIVAFGWHAMEIDGHHVGEIDKAYPRRGPPPHSPSRSWPER